MTPLIKNFFDKIGINKDDWLRAGEILGMAYLEKLLDDRMNEKAKTIDEKANHCLSKENIRNEASQDLITERKHMFRLLRKQSENDESALVTLFFWISDPTIEIRSILELCEYHTTAKVAAARSIGISFDTIDMFLEYDVDGEIFDSLSS